MSFNNIKVKEIISIMHYEHNISTWETLNRPFHIIGVHLKGSALHTFDTQKFVMSENCIYFLNSKDDYKVDVLEPTHVFSIHFLTYEPIDTKSFCIKLSNIDEIINLQNKILYQRNLSPVDTNTTFSLFYKHLSTVDAIYKKKYSPTDPRITRAKDYINLNFSGKNCLSEASALSGLSRRRFNDLFKAQFNTSPNRYIILKKIDYAKTLISTTTLSVSEISFMCGFSDENYFIKVFKNETGCTPAKYRHHIKP